MGNSDTTNPIRRVYQEKDSLVVEVAGDIDLRRSLEFQQSLMKLLDRGARRIVLDLAGVPYMDSSGVASLVKLLSRVRREGMDLKLCRLTERVRSIFEITRLDTVFPICASLQEAVT